jgi:hypothetical protein
MSYASEGSACACEERIGDVVGLAQTQCEPENDALADARDGRIGETVGSAKRAGRGVEGDAVTN